jgi:hypothetical protein
LAVRNNALWCDAVYRAHGKPGEFLPDLWFNRHAGLPFYPNAITLSTGSGRTGQVAQIAKLAAVGLPGGWGVKDSFAALDLTPLGFAPLFAAEWIWRAAGLEGSEPAPPELRWERLLDERALTNWEAAWNGEPPAGEPAPDRLFLPALLADPAIAFLAAYTGDRIVAGAIANLTGEVVGLSNFFLPADGPAPYWAGCLAAITRLFPGRAIVGYERNDALLQAQRAGFSSLGTLQIWIKQADQ